MTSGLTEKINRKGNVEISQSFPLSDAKSWLILGFLKSIKQSSKLMPLGDECSEPDLAACENYSANMARVSQSLFLWKLLRRGEAVIHKNPSLELFFSELRSREGTVLPKYLQGLSPEWELPHWSLEGSGIFPCRPLKTQNPRKKTVTVEFGSFYIYLFARGLQWFVQGVTTSLCCSRVVPIHSAQPEPSPAGRWWHHRVFCAQNGSLCVWFKGSCGQGEPHGLGELCSLWWICGVPNKLNQSLPLANAIIWTAGFIDFAKSIAIFINHL